VAIAVDSVAARERSLVKSTSRLTVLQAWHLFSLDAPTVAALWAIFFARATRVSLAWPSPAILALGTWLIYVADRILDGYRPCAGARLHERHRFHARHRAAFLCAGVVVGGILVWLIADKMFPAARREDTVLFLLSLLYLFLVHKPFARSRSWLPKELAVGIVFAAATAVPAWSRIESGRLTLLPAVALFAALCWLNCIAIERWENDFAVDGLANLNATTLWTAEHLRPMAIFLMATSGVMWAVAGAGSSPMAWPYAAVMGSCSVFVIVDRRRERFSAIHLRILADLALLAPIFVLPFLS